MALTEVNSLGIKDDSIVNADIKSDAAIALSKLASTPAVLTGSTNNTVCTVTGANAIQGEANLTYDGTDLLLNGTGDKALRWTTSGTNKWTIYHNNSAGALVTFDNANNAERMRLDSSGRLLIGTTTEGHADADNLTIETSSGYAGITLRSPTDTGGAIYFSDATSGAAEYDGQIVYSQNSRNMTFATAGSSRMTVEAAGDVKVNDGNLVIGTAGHGIDFSANSHAGGMTSELLDGYEEGTFTMHFNVESESNMSMSGRFGVYTKVGRLVTIHGGGEVSGDPSNQSNSKAIDFTGLPFTSMDSGVMNSPGITGTVGFTDLDSTSGMSGTAPYTYHVQFYNNGTNGRIVAQDSATTPVFANASLALKSTTKISVTLTYMTA